LTAIPPRLQITAKLVIVPALTAGDLMRGAIDSDRTRHLAAGNEVIEHVLAADALHDTVVAMARRRLLRLERELAGRSLSLVPELESVASVVVSLERAAVEVELEPLGPDDDVALEQAIRVWDVPLHQDFLERPPQARIPGAF